MQCSFISSYCLPSYLRVNYRSKNFSSGNKKFFWLKILICQFFYSSFSYSFSSAPPIIRCKWTVINNILSFNYTAESFHVHDHRMQATICPLRLTVFISFLFTRNSVQNEKLVSCSVFSHPSYTFAHSPIFLFDASIICGIVSVTNH